MTSQYRIRVEKILKSIKENKSLVERGYVYDELHDELYPPHDFNTSAWRDVDFKVTEQNKGVLKVLDDLGYITDDEKGYRDSDGILHVCLEAHIEFEVGPAEDHLLGDDEYEVTDLEEVLVSSIDESKTADLLPFMSEEDRDSLMSILYEYIW